jgi:GMP reductase
MKENFDYNDITLIPEKCTVNSRSECDTKIQLGKYIFNVPIVPANMVAVVNEEIAIKLATNDYFYIMHRFNVNIVQFVLKMKTLKLFSSISIGVQKLDYDLINELYNRNIIPEFITIDIAHGHSDKVDDAIKYIKNLMPETFIIAGNVCTEEATIFLDKAGADGIKVGIAPGHACSTFMETGFGSRGCQLSTIKECRNVTDKIIIADGGINLPGDITKSIVFGANLVMCGNMFSGCIDSPGNIVENNNIKYKEYFGSASVHNNKTNRIEGVKKLVLLKDKTILEELEHLKESLQSSISYGGGNCIKDLKKVEYKLI